MKGEPVDVRFWSKVDRKSDEECWPWLGASSAGGYGIFFLGGTRVDPVYRPAHRVSYEWLVGPIPEGLHIDHICRNPPCVNPAHLEPVTNAENVRRGYESRGLKTHCKWGHQLAGDNVLLERGSRICRACKRERWDGRRTA